MAAVTVKCVLNKEKPAVGLCQHSVCCQLQAAQLSSTTGLKKNTEKLLISPQIIKAQDTMLAEQGAKVRPLIGVMGLHVKPAKHSLLSEECFNERCVKTNSGASAESPWPLCLPADLELHKAGFYPRSPLTSCELLHNK